MNAKEEHVLSECGFISSDHKAHATEYKHKNIVIYTVDIKQLNVVINPEDYVYMKGFDCEKIHNSNFTVFLKELNNGENEIHYGYKIVFDDSLSMKQFLLDYLKYKEKQPVKGN